jgi:hypothetical protein
MAPKTPSSSGRITTLARDRLGIARLLPAQRRAIGAVLDGTDALVVM